MATIKDLINELEVISIAFTGVESFIYNRFSAVNWQDRTKAYPCIIVDSSIDVSLGSSNKNYLPKKHSYSIRIGLVDEYKKDEQVSKSLQEKQSELFLKLDQYIAEIQRRAIADSTKGFNVGALENIRGYFGFPVYNDMLAGVYYTVQFEVYGECTTGTFNY